MDSTTNSLDRVQDAEIEIAGERVVLMPERAIFWPARSTLLVADPHFGKAATFRAGGIFVPRGTTSRALARLAAAIDRMRAARLVFLGDLLHAREGRSPETLRVIAEWRAARSSMEVLLVRGNHDRRAGDPPPELNISCREAPLFAGAFAFAHHPAPLADHHVLAGHIHPGVRLSGAGRQSHRLSCFWIRPDITVLPAFGDFTGLGDIEVSGDDRVFAIADREVIEVPVESERTS